MPPTCPRCRSLRVAPGGDGISYVCLVCSNVWVSAALQHIADGDRLQGPVRFSQDAALFRAEGAAPREGRRRLSRSWRAATAGLSDERFTQGLALEYLAALRSWYAESPLLCEAGFAVRGRPPRPGPAAPLVPPSAGLSPVFYEAQFSEARAILSKLFSRYRAIMKQLSQAVGARLIGTPHSAQKLSVQRRLGAIMAGAAKGAAEPGLRHSLRPTAGGLVSKHLALPAALAVLAAQLAGVPADAADVVRACRARARASALFESARQASRGGGGVGAGGASGGGQGGAAAGAVPSASASGPGGSAASQRDAEGVVLPPDQVVGSPDPPPPVAAAPAVPAFRPLTELGAVAARVKLSRRDCRAVLRTLAFLLLPPPVRLTPTFDVRPRVASLAAETCGLVEAGVRIRGLSPLVSGASLLMAARLPRLLPGSSAWRPVPTAGAERAAPALEVCMGGPEAFSATCVGLGFCFVVQFYGLVGRRGGPRQCASPLVTVNTPASDSPSSEPLTRTLEQRFLGPTCLLSWDAINARLEFSPGEYLLDSLGHDTHRFERRWEGSGLFEVLTDRAAARPYRLLSSVYHREIYVAQGGLTQGNRGGRHASRINRLFALMDRASDLVGGVLDGETFVGDRTPGSERLSERESQLVVRSAEPAPAPGARRRGNKLPTEEFALRPFSPIFFYDPLDLVLNDCLVFRRAASVLAGRAELSLERFVYILTGAFRHLVEGCGEEPGGGGEGEEEEGEGGEGESEGEGGEGSAGEGQEAAGLGTEPGVGPGAEPGAARAPPQASP